MMAPILNQFLGSTFGNEKLSNAKVAHSFLFIFRLLQIVFEIVSFLGGFSNLILFMSELGLLCLKTCLCFRILIIDDCECQIEEEEGADENESCEEEKYERRIGLLVHDHDIRPTLKRDALEDIQKGPKDVVKVRYIVVRV